jgi:hypothetical protein
VNAVHGISNRVEDRHPLDKFTGVPGCDAGNKPGAAAKQALHLRSPLATRDALQDDRHFRCQQ